jgi:hypothetical protein
MSSSSRTASRDGSIPQCRRPAPRVSNQGSRALDPEVRPLGSTAAEQALVARQLWAVAGPPG